ncbi:MAG: translesion DNA synthesis-associated protein ImuA [Rhodanobacteraceae bacterium]|nr:translesion DNA synthesis-associated protein ImuA [Rhodanobacteraceae bacterium]
MSSVGLNEVLRYPGIWRRSSGSAPTLRTQATGCAELDSLLPGGGWPLGALSEILFTQDGLGELSLLTPALAELTQRRRRVVFVAPPYIPYAPALQNHGVDLNFVTQIQASNGDSSWSAEQCLRSGGCGAVLCWLHKTDYAQLRRLQLAAETGGSIGFVFRPAAAAHSASPSGLRLLVDNDRETTHIEVLKCRGGLDTRRDTRLRWNG